MSRSLSSTHYVAMLSILTAARKSAGLLQVDVAERLGMPQSFVSKFERGERRLDVVEFIIIARAIGADASGLLAAVAAEVPEGARL